jgi:quercetin dioxygenase-like cupin family protein
MIKRHDPRMKALCAGMICAALGACSHGAASAGSAVSHTLVPLVVDHRALLASKPDLQAPTVTIWKIQQTPSIRVNLVEMRGHLRRHLHPDAAHSLLVLEGSVRASVGEQEILMNEGDFVSIPPGVPHDYTTVGPSALLISCDAPYYDPGKTVYVADSSAP